VVQYIATAWKQREVVQENEQITSGNQREEVEGARL